MTRASEQYFLLSCALRRHGPETFLPALQELALLSTTPHYVRVRAQRAVDEYKDKQKKTA